MVDARSLAGALQWGLFTYVGVSTFLSLPINNASFWFVSLPAGLLALVAAVGGSLHVRSREETGEMARVAHARRVESVVALSVVQVVAWFALRALTSVVVAVLPNVVAPFELLWSLPDVTALIAAFLLAYAVDTRWLLPVGGERTAAS